MTDHIELGCPHTAVAMSEPEFAGRLESAYIRGATWSQELGGDHLIDKLRKAAADNADDTIRCMTRAPAGSQVIICKDEVIGNQVVKTIEDLTRERDLAIKAHAVMVSARNIEAEFRARAEAKLARARTALVESRGWIVLAEDCGRDTSKALALVDTALRFTSESGNA